MHVITVGSIIERARKEQKAISQKTLIQGICSIQTLYAIETNQYKTDILLVDILLQRLGKSPDKLEIILSQEAYQLVRQRDLIEEAILRGRKARQRNIKQTRKRSSWQNLLTFIKAASRTISSTTLTPSL